MLILFDVVDDVLVEVVKGMFEVVLFDIRIIKLGFYWFWMVNMLDYGFEMKVVVIDMEVLFGDIEEFWCSGLEIIDLLDVGL